MRVQFKHDMKKQMVIDRLHQLGFHETDGLSYRELKRKLVLEDAKRVKVGSPHNTWF